MFYEAQPYWRLYMRQKARLFFKDNFSARGTVSIEKHKPRFKYKSHLFLFAIPTGDNEF